VILKEAYDELMVSKGVSNPDMVQVVAEINQYLISHNTSAAVSSVQCEECHTKNSDGRFTAGLTNSGLLGEEHTAPVTTLVDSKLVKDGLVVLDMPYMQVDVAGAVTENVSDILYHSKVDPSMTALKSARAEVATGTLVEVTVADALVDANFSSEDSLLVQEQLSITDVFWYQANYGDSALRDVNIMVEKTGDES